MLFKITISLDAFRIEGWRGMYKGMAPYLLHVTPNICIVFLFYEQITQTAAMWRLQWQEEKKQLLLRQQQKEELLLRQQKELLPRQQQELLRQSGSVLSRDSEGELLLAEKPDELLRQQHESEALPGRKPELLPGKQAEESLRQQQENEMVLKKMSQHPNINDISSDKQMSFRESSGRMVKTETLLNRAIVPKIEGCTDVLSTKQTVNVLIHNNQKSSDCPCSSNR